LILACNNYQSSWCSIHANPNRKYYGRGMLQLSYPCHYYEAGKALGLDLLNDPDLVSQSDTVAAATAIWFYQRTGMNEFAQQGQFGDTTRRLNRYQCSGQVGYNKQMIRVKIYHKVRKCFSLPETSVNLTC
jgi:predicted chitinase